MSNVGISQSSLRRIGAGRTGPSSDGTRSARKGRKPTTATVEAHASHEWLRYREAAAYCGWSVKHLRNLVSEDRIPVYGKPRLRRFRRDMLDLFLTNPDAAMRKFRAERNTHGS